MEPPVAATLTTAAGIGLHLASPTIAYVVGRSARIRKRISPEHAYDLFTTIGAALCLFALLELSIFPVGQILTFGLLFGLMAGAVAPLALWRAYGKTPTIRRPTPRTISLALLALCAVAEEIIWRVTVVHLVHNGLDAPYWIAIVVSIAGFAALHLGLHGARSVPYSVGFGALAVCLTIFLGVGAAIGFHLAHNLVIALVHPKPRDSYVRPVASEVKW
ncbi:type II CAAX prenyl endopeptidase Rce1 family protein [Auritidibacter sp. NML100628]|uniref:CPBP family glutamic-type intramembrane protease n=1 Tax=Auritidibacter sp. NML100628 TaxID=2170742 RepID=UPI000D73C26A|nr:CPBP family glutamic-type intramembrane protease [Auritidibacter sp. NML100628]PXA76874.1 hypothetical protein DCC24_06145 [Auritidibacter sp. NML100628]